MFFLLSLDSESQIAELRCEMCHKYYKDITTNFMKVLKFTINKSLLCLNQG